MAKATPLVLRRRAQVSDSTRDRTMIKADSFTGFVHPQAQPHDQIPMNAHWSNGMISSPTFLAPPAQFGARARGRPRHNRRGGNGRAGHHGYGGGGDLVPGPGEHVEIETISRNGQTWNKPKIVKDKPFGTIYGYHGSDKHVGVMPSHLAGGMQTPMYTGGLQAHQMYAPPHQQMYAPPHQQVYVPPAQQMYMQPAQPAQQPAQGNVVPVSDRIDQHYSIT